MKAKTSFTPCASWNPALSWSSSERPSRRERLGPPAEEHVEEGHGFYDDDVFGKIQIQEEPKSRIQHRDL
jgi:hypothetical protein